ncbi:MAG: 50S ribosomal protein L25 [Chloroflexi bacterium]|nr:50S ribosomal protein L25 [Chloroflexota bacterium]
MDQITVEAQPRTALGKKVGALRRSGITPIHVYGSKVESLTLQTSTVDLVHALNTAGLTTPITVKVGSDEHFVVVKQIQKHPVTDRVLHVDLFTISRTERIHASVPLHFEGEALAAREEGAQLSEDLHELMLEAMALEMPHGITVDLAPIVDLDSVIYAADVVLPAGVTLVTDPTAIVVRIAHRRGAGGGETDGAPAAAAGATEGA